MVAAHLSRPNGQGRGLACLAVLLAAPMVGDVLISAPADYEALIDLCALAAFAVAMGLGLLLLRRTHRADAALQRSEAQLRTLIDTAFDGVLVTDDRGRLVSMNRAAETLFGVTGSEMAGRHFRHLLTQAGFEAHQAHVARWFADPAASQSLLGQSEGRRRTGEAFPVEFSLASWTDGGRPLYAAIFRDVTERAAAEVAIRRSEAQHRAIIDTAGDGIMVFDGEGRIVSYNRAAQTIFGYLPEEAIGRRVGLLMTEEQRLEKTYMARYAPGVEPGVFACRRVERRRKNGEVFPLELSVTEWRDGEASFYTAMMRDVSERERAEASLRESEERYSRIFAHSLELISLFDVRADGGFAYNAINPAAEQLTGMRNADLAGRTPQEVLRPEVAARTLETLRRGFAAGEPIEVEGSLRRPDGSAANLTHQLVPIRDGEGRITQMLAKSRDVTEAKRAAAVLRESREQFERLFDHSADALFVVLIEPDGTVAYERVNRAARALLGVGEMNIAGKRLEEVVPPEIARTATAGYLRCAAEGVVIATEDEFVLDGQRRSFHANLVPIPDAEGRITRVLASSREITDRLRAEERLRASQKLEAVGRLAGGMAHDFNNLLLVVDGYARRALEIVDRDGEAGQAAREILKAAERGTQLVKQLLVFSRHRVDEATRVPVAPAIREILALLAPLLGATHPVKIWIDEAVANRAVQADPAELAQAVMNLATNARDAMPGGGTVQIDVEFVELDAAGAEPLGLGAGRYVELGVHDTGAGMDPATAARAFEPFFTTKEQGKGTGLGLSMVYGFAQRCGGAVSASSTPGAGSSFRLVLPASVCELQAETTEPQALNRSGGETILLVEDDVQLLALMARTLEGQGYRVITAQNGAEALDVAEDHEGDIELVLSDVVMPVLGGPEMAEALRRSRPNARVVFMSGYPARGESQARGFPADAAFLSKPFTPGELARTLSSALASPRREEVAAA